jgi:hypothetical protein
VRRCEEDTRFFRGTTPVETGRAKPLICREGYGNNHGRQLENCDTLTS